MNVLIDDLQKMNAQELKIIANDDLYFGLAGTVDTKQRSELLEQDVALSDNKDSLNVIGVIETPLLVIPPPGSVSIDEWNDEQLLEAGWKQEQIDAMRSS